MKRLSGFAIALLLVNSVCFMSAGRSTSVLAASTYSPVGTGSTAKTVSKKQIAIVIDDFGNRMEGTPEMLALPVSITVAVMPFLPTTKEDAHLAHKLGHDVIVHLPMEPLKGRASWLGPGAITTALSDVEIRQRVEAAINDVPHAVGMNNHMGSKATADARVMRVVLKVCQERGLFFLDSRTNWKTVIPQVAEELGVAIASNQVFLDDVHSKSHIQKQVGVIRQELQKYDLCITIGHVGPSGKKTAAVLKKSISELQPEVTFVKVSETVGTTPWGTMQENK